jgi:hypothetical protein
MKLIDVGNGQYINIEYVEAVKDDYGITKVYMHSGVSFDTIYPLSTFVEMVNMVKPEMSQMAESLKRMEGVSSQIGTFAG